MKSNSFDENEVCRRYTETNDGISKIAEDWHVDKKKIRKCLIEHGIEIKKKGKQPLKEDFVVENWRVEKYPEKEGFEYIAVDRKTGYETFDVNNRGGFLTTHIEKEYGVKTPTLYDRRLYYMRTGDYWWEQWFDIVQREKKPTKKCKYCDWETEDVNNLSGAYLVHLKNAHGVSREEYLKEFPEEKPYFALVSQTKNRQMSDNESNYVVCQECGMKLGIISAGHLKTHGMTRLDYMKKYGRQKMVADETHEKLSLHAQMSNENTTFTRSSAPEKEIEDYITNLGIGVEVGNRKVLQGKEIDLYMPDLKIGFEYDGLLYHTEDYGKDKDYHLLKTEKGIQNGITLFHIFEDEYRWKKNFVYTKIKEIIMGDENKTSPILSECNICEVNNTIASYFIEQYGIKSKNNQSTISIGAFFKYQLIAVVCFEKLDNNVWQINNIATDYNYRCNNVVKEVFEFFKTKYSYSKIIGYADRRWFPKDGSTIFNMLGFEVAETTEPQCWYFRNKHNELKRRNEEEVKEITSLVKDNYPEGTSDDEIATDIGFMRIWDCGLLRYVYRTPKSEIKTED